MNQELLNLAKEIDDNEDAINEALEQDDFDRAVELSDYKNKLFQRLYTLSQDVSPDERAEFNEYLNSLYEVTIEQRDILAQEHEKMRAELRGLSKSAKSSNAYRQVRKYTR